MIKSGKGLILAAAMAIIVAVAAPGCATKKYVSQQINPVNQKLSQYQKDTNGKITWLTNKQQTDVSALNERIATTDQRVAEVSTAVQEAQGTASRAMEATDANKTAIETNRTAITNVKDSLNYQLVEKADVFFDFGKATLRPSARAELDAIAAKAQAMPRSVIELAGFTDHVGTRNYNDELSRRRAWTVQRYLIEHNVPARSIHVVGLGEQMNPPPDGLGLETASTATTKSGQRQMQRRVSIRLFGAGELTGTDGGPQQ
jgi:outer membrane protein OmpA-like peptidoglycan-associated protein